MSDHQTVEKARKQLPDPDTFNSNYIDIKVPLDNGDYEVVKFTKIISDGEVIWMDLPESDN